MAEKLRVGIAGAAGWMAGALTAGVEYDENGYNKETKAGTKNEFSTVTALCDLKEDVMQARKEELNLDQAEFFTSYDEMLKSDNVDAVVVSVPSNLHAAFAIKCLEAGKHLFLEKPYATTYEDALLLAEATEKSDVTTKLDYILVHYDEQERLKELIDQGAFGIIGSTFFSYRHPITLSESEDQLWKLSRERSGGAIPMGVCHALSLTVFQVDSDPVSVICKSSPPKLRNFDYDTQQDIMIVFENGVVSVVQGNIDFAEKYDARHTIVGTEGQFDYNPYNPHDSRVMWSSKPLNREYAPHPEFGQDHLDSGDVWKHKCTKTVQDFVKHALNGEKDPLLGFESPLVKRTEKIVWACEKSAQQNGAPVNPNNL